MDQVTAEDRCFRASLARSAAVPQPSNTYRFECTKIRTALTPQIGAWEHAQIYFNAMPYQDLRSRKATAVTPGLVKQRLTPLPLADGCEQADQFLLLLVRRQIAGK